MSALLASPEGAVSCTERRGRSLVFFAGREEGRRFCADGK